MKKRTLLTAGLTMLLGLTSIQAQQVVNINKSEKQLYQVSIPENMQLREFGNQRIITSKDTRADDAVEKVNFTFKGICEKGFRPSDGLLISKEGRKNLAFRGELEASESMPAGIYNAHVTFRDAYDQMYIVIKENIKITEGTVVEFDVSEATNGLTYKYYDENNQELYVDRYDISYVKQENGTVQSLSSNIMLCHKDLGVELILMSEGYHPIGYEESFFINVPSDKYYIGTSTCATRADFTNYVFKSVVTDFKTQTIVNNPENLTYREATVENTPVAKDDLNAHFPYQNVVVLSGGKEALNALAYYTTNLDEKYKTFKFWLDTPMSNIDDDIEFDVLYKPAYNDYLTETSWGGFNRFAVKAPGYVGNKQTGVVLFNNGTDMFGVYNKTPEFTKGKYFPCHPDLSFNVEDKITFGNSAPVCSFAPAFYRDGNQIAGFMKANYIGRYGENYEASKELVKSASSMNEIEGGKMEIFVPNYNVEVDGMEGENISRMVLNPNKEDFITPTLHMLSVIDENGKVNDRLATVSGTKLIMAGADYTYSYIPEKWFGYFTCHDVAVELYYTIHDYEDDWKQLDVKKTSDMPFDQVYGNIYEVALDNVQTEDPESWIDLKVVLTDESGNYQEQIIRPVFYVENISTGVKQVRKEGLDILVFDNTIRLTAENKAQINIFSVDGTNVMSANGNEISIENLTPGVYVVNATSGSDSVNKKFIKK